MDLGLSDVEAQVGAFWPDHPLFRRCLAHFSHLRETGRSVAQPGSALASGARGREFESPRSDQSALGLGGGCEGQSGTDLERTFSAIRPWGLDLRRSTVLPLHRRPVVTSVVTSSLTSRAGRRGSRDTPLNPLECQCVSGKRSADEIWRWECRLVSFREPIVNSRHPLGTRMAFTRSADESSGQFPPIHGTRSTSTLAQSPRPGRYRSTMMWVRCSPRLVSSCRSSADIGAKSVG